MANNHIILLHSDLVVFVVVAAKSKSRLPPAETPDWSFKLKPASLRNEIEMEKLYELQ